MIIINNTYQLHFITLHNSKFHERSMPKIEEKTGKDRVSMKLVHHQDLALKK